MSKERIDYFDYVKGIAILLVIWGHLNYCNDNIRMFIYSFHMPLFFIVSGALIRYIGIDSDLKKGLIKKFKALIVPYFTFGILSILIQLNFSEFNDETFSYYIKRLLTLQGFDALWFLPSMFFSIIIFMVLKKYIKNDFIIAGSCIFLFIVGLTQNSMESIFLLILFRVFVALFFIAFGYYLFEVIKKYDVPLSLSIVGMIIVYFASQYNGDVEIYALQLNNKFIFIFTSLFGTYFLINMFKNEKNNKALLFLGKNSLLIMLTHQIIIRAFKNYGFVISGHRKMALFLVVIAFIEVPIIFIVNKFLPFMIGRKYKGSIDKIKG
ncbi:acyltransferase family protein [Clostridium sp. BJN0001]|uniref:acyltransferase family protein n=1 Tax=Clostridium sp. BJN0001 TaxID=2930219 RepID=UPI001FD14952|nr:acyltransferase family protein [Clostridium sp. BJN0001]